jgi:predicted nucleic acid binding AN1-type Zn finger protein
MELGAFTTPIYIIKKVQSQINYKRACIARTLIPYYIVMNDNWVSHYTSSQIDTLMNKKQCTWV